MQRHNFRRTLRACISLIGAFSFLSIAPALEARCAAPPERLAAVRIDGATILEGLFAFGLTNNICFGIELDNDELLRSLIHFETSGSTALAAVRKALAAHPDYSVADSGLVSVRPAMRAAPTWLDVRIAHFDGGTGPIQVVNNLLFVYLLDEIKPRQGIASHYHLGDVNDVIGPIEESGKTVRELLNLLVGSSKGGMWVTTAPSDRTPSDPDRFWTILEYSDQRMRDGVAVRSMARDMASVFARRPTPR